MFEKKKYKHMKKNYIQPMTDVQDIDMNPVMEAASFDITIGGEQENPVGEAPSAWEDDWEDFEW